MDPLNSWWIEIIGGMTAGILAALLSYLIEPIWRRWFRKETIVPQVSYKDKISKLIESLSKASDNIDSIMREIAEVGQQRETAITQLEKHLKSLSKQEKQLKEKINALEKVPLPAIEYFAKTTEKSERKSALRDYILFGAGVVVSALFTILFRFFGL